MQQSLEIINHLNEKLTSEIEKRKNDLKRSIKRSEFMRNEQKSLALAMQNIAIEIKKMHRIIGKSAIGYFLEIRPIQMQAVNDAPNALNRYLKQMELEKQSLDERKRSVALSLSKQGRTPLPMKQRNASSHNLHMGSSGQRKFVDSGRIHTKKDE